MEGFRHVLWSAKTRKAQIKAASGVRLVDGDRIEIGVLAFAGDSQRSPLNEDSTGQIRTIEFEVDHESYRKRTQGLHTYQCISNGRIDLAGRTADKYPPDRREDRIEPIVSHNTGHSVPNILRP